MSPSVYQEPDAGTHQCQGEAGVEDSDERFRQELEITRYDAEGNHESHDDPSFGIEKSERTVLVLFLGNPAGMFLIKPMEDESEEKQEYQGGFADFE